MRNMYQAHCLIAEQSLRPSVFPNATQCVVLPIDTMTDACYELYTVDDKCKTAHCETGKKNRTTDTDGFAAALKCIMIIVQN